MPSQKTKTKCIFLTPVSFSLRALFTTLQCLIFCQLLFTIFSPISVSVNAVYIFPLRLSPKYYIPGLLEPPKSRSAHQLNSLHKALKYLHTSKSAAEVTNAFLRKISEDSESSESQASPTSASAIPTSTTTGATVATRKTTRNSGGNSHALPLNEQITGKFADQLRSSKPVDTEFEEKLVLIVFKLPVKRTRERQRRYKRQRPSLQFYQRSADPSSMVTASSSRTMSIGNKIRSWWEGTTGNQQQRPTSSTPKFQPTYKFTYSEGPIPYNSERPWAFRSTTARASNANSNGFLNLDKFFWKSTSPPAKRPPRPGGGPPPNPTSGRGLLPSPSTTPFLSFGDYYFNGPGCQPRGPKLILCTTDRIEHLSNLLEKFMHYHEKNNLQYAKQSASKFVDDDEDYDDSRGDDSNYKYRLLGKNNKNKKKKPKGPKKHPSVVVVAMNRDEEIDDLEDHHEDDDEFMTHRTESLESIIEDHDDSSHEHDDDEPIEKDPLFMLVKGSGKRPEVLIQGSLGGSKGKNKSSRTKRKLKRSHNHHDMNPPFSFSEEMRNYDYAEKEGNRNRYFYFLQNKKKNLDDSRDHYKRNQLDERIRETEAEYKRLNMLLELVKKYQELA